MKKNHLLIEYDPGDGEVGAYEVAVTKDEANDQRIKMWYSKTDSSWCKGVGGRECISLHDNGSGVCVKLPNGKDNFYDYSEIEYLMLILNYYHNDSHLDKWKPKTRIWKKKKYKKMEKKYGKR